MSKKSTVTKVLSRREILTGTAILLAGTSVGYTRPIFNGLPWAPNSGNPPTPVRPGPWLFFTAAEARAMEAIADRIIPPDPQTPGGKDSGCVVFVDRQLAGPYGRQDGLYLSPPFDTGAPNQGLQAEAGPAQKYREGLAALEQACKSKHADKAFADLSDSEQDAVLTELEKGQLKLEDTDGPSFFGQLIKDVQMGFFADPVYGGNRDMVAWKMIGYPGTRYNYLDWVHRHNEPFPLPPVGMTGRAEWTPKTG